MDECLQEKQHWCLWLFLYYTNPAFQVEEAFLHRLSKLRFKSSILLIHVFQSIKCRSIIQVFGIRFYIFFHKYPRCCFQDKGTLGLKYEYQDCSFQDTFIYVIDGNFRGYQVYVFMGTWFSTVYSCKQYLAVFHCAHSAILICTVWGLIKF